ncbi:topoisomerase DNA-binding C4 zinc finger domain-containing protein [Vibrio owensii]|uniref:topoisomerase DNA-binding C4 zinc finger domain-containing protein n=1 Tax=Vibrio owensii TaxID=696485 RepID=UPI001D1146C0|nr:topoisomerase DNA-binding C4 zinc finger domain-containing protein [Vibrio owensii]
MNQYIHLQVEHVKTHGVPFVKRNGATCPTCQQGTLIKRPGKHVPFHACNHYPDCKTTFPDDNDQPNLNPKPRKKWNRVPTSFVSSVAPLSASPRKTHLGGDAAVFRSVKCAFSIRMVSQIETVVNCRDRFSPMAFT